MSRTNSIRRHAPTTLLGILRRMGASISRDDEVAIIEAKDRDPEITTADIILSLDLATPDEVRKAIDIAREAGSTELLEDCYTQARAKIREVQQAASRLEQSACAVSRNTGK